MLARPFLWAHSSFLSLVGWLARFFSVPPWPWLVCSGMDVGGAPCSGCCGLVPCSSSALCCPLAFGPWALGLVFFFGAGPCLFLGAWLCCPVRGAPFLRWLCFLLSTPFCRLTFPPYVPLLSTWCPWVVWWLRFRLFLLGVLLPLWLPRSRSCARSWVPWGSRGKGGVLLGCCLAAWCLSCLLGVPLRRRPLPVVVFRLGVEAWVSGG